MKYIAKRIQGGWTNSQPNTDKLNCDDCGARLWVAPDGKTLYCDNASDKHTYSDEIAAVMQYADGSYAPAVLTRDGNDYWAWVYRHESGTTFKQAMKAARHTLEVGTKGYLNDNWTAYTNAAGTLEWLRGQDFKF